MTLLVIYLAVLVLLPIITVWLDKIFPGSMEIGDDDDSFTAMFMLTSLLWPIGIFLVAHSILKYWYKH